MDNADLYRVLYVADRSAGAIAEAFGSFEMWTSAMFGELPAIPSSVRALATYDLADSAAILNLDDAQALIEWGLRPSEVVTRERRTTQAWARRIFNSGRFSGVRWWSFYNPDWASLGLWDYSRLTVRSVERLSPESPQVEEARVYLMRSWVR